MMEACLPGIEDLSGKGYFILERENCSVVRQRFYGSTKAFAFGSNNQRFVSISADEALDNYLFI